MKDFFYSVFGQGGRHVICFPHRNAISKINGATKLRGTVEFDEEYFSLATPKSKKNKRVRGSKKKAKVAVMVESFPLENPSSGQKYYATENFKMSIKNGYQKKKIEQLLIDKIAKNSILITDKCPSYNGIRKNFEYFPSLSPEHNFQ